MNGLSITEGFKLIGSNTSRRSVSNYALIIGESDLQRRLLTDLTEYIEPLCSVDDINKLDAVPYRLSNKYYVADVILRLYPSLDFSQGTKNFDLKNFKAFILLYNASMPLSFKTIKPWISLLRDFDQETMICAAYDIEIKRPLDSDIVNLEDDFKYCIDNYIEFLDMSETQDSYPNQILPSTLTQKWTTSTERIAESLSFIQWDEIKFHKTPKQRI